jgi:hypothetical protein
MFSEKFGWKPIETAPVDQDVALIVTDHRCRRAAELDAPQSRLFLRRLLALPNCAGASNATIRNSSRRSGSDISKAADGAASTTTPRCASRLTASWSPSGRRFPPQDLVPPGCSKNLPFPPVTDPAAPPLRTERHIPNSIATMRRRMIIALAQHLSRCPCCQRAMPARSQRGNL